MYKIVKRKFVGNSIGYFKVVYGLWYIKWHFVHWPQEDYIISPVQCRKTVCLNTHALSILMISSSHVTFCNIWTRKDFTTLNVFRQHCVDAICIHIHLVLKKSLLLGKVFNICAKYNCSCISSITARVAPKESQ